MFLRPCMSWPLLTLRAFFSILLSPFTVPAIPSSVFGTCQAFCFPRLWLQSITERDLKLLADKFESKGWTLSVEGDSNLSLLTANANGFCNPGALDICLIARRQVPGELCQHLKGKSHLPGRLWFRLTWNAISCFVQLCALDATVLKNL